ncbi:HNH/ENDO VII superfamily nuclease with conserved GHE residues [Janthinobacterium sp. 344]|nr:HNH/ENDO VII superfamily nuclease with conserved GHE residues [Janthinobacterium sp. 551a]SFB45501.1 HNH/ENDO VII superfamily nuclease with conserved GHE residues [Janthinobacterium sp. 344]
MSTARPPGPKAAAPIPGVWSSREHEDVLAQAVQHINQDEKAAAQRAAIVRTSVPSGTNRIGARRDGGFKAISTAPSINKTPIGPAMVPLPYPTVQDLSNSISTASTVRFNGKPAYVLGGSTQPKGMGDEAGTGKGVRSGTVAGEIKPVVGSSTVRVEGKYIVRDGDACTMNGGNNPGIYVTASAPACGISKGKFTGETNPLVHAQTPAEESWLSSWWKNTKHELNEAVEHPWEAAKGAAKGIANIPSSIGELLMKGATLQSASDMEQAAAMQSVFGQTEAAQRMSASAEQVRQGVDAIHLPMFEMSNAAQAGGDKILTAATLAAGGVGIARSGVKGLAGLGKSASIADAEATKVMSTGAKAAQTEQALSKSAVMADDLVAAPIATPAGNGVKILRKIKSLREKYLGRTPGKESRTGREVQARMRADKTLRDNAFTGQPEFLASDNKWYELRFADMAHKEDAVSWWNRVGRQYGAQAPEVRTWMLESKNYVLDLNSLNRSAGAKLKVRYLPPLK